VPPFPNELADLPSARNPRGARSIARAMMTTRTFLGTLTAFSIAACTPAAHRPAPPAGYDLEGSVHFTVERSDSTDDVATLRAFEQAIENGGGDPAHWEYTTAKLEVWRGDDLVRTLEHEGDLALPAGEYRIRLVWPDGRVQELAHFTLARERCFDGKTAWVERAAVGASALFHDAYVPPGVSVMRIAPRYPGIHTRVEWSQGGEVVSQKVIEDDAPSFSLDGETDEGALSRELVDASGGSCATLWRELGVSLAIPPEVLARGGPFVLRLMSPDTRGLEVDVEVPRGLHAGTPGAVIHLPPDWKPAEQPLTVRTVEPRPDELAWARAMEKTYRINASAGRDPFADPIPITVEVWRAITRRPELAAELAEFLLHRHAGSAHAVDRADALRAGVARGETVASIDARLDRRQRELDQDDADDNAQLRARERTLRARILAGVAKYGHRPFGDDELP
jgi:hypothetical protein